MKEFNSAFSSTTETSSGNDQITYSMIKHAHPTMVQRILNLFNFIFLENTFPSSWKIAIIIPIPKPGKDPTNPTNYRPISLTSCLCKLMEKIINVRLVWYLERNKLINKMQSSFRNNRSTTDQLTELESDIQNAISHKEDTIVIMFDLQKAYDTARRHGVLMKMHKYGLGGNLPKFVNNFINDRKIQVRVGKALSNVVELQQGIPQGSVLSCTCFMIAINDIR